VPVRNRPRRENGSAPSRRRGADDVAVAGESSAGCQRDPDSVCEHENSQAGLVTIRDGRRTDCRHCDIFHSAIAVKASRQGWAG
jgi:hypothetical protein